MKTDREQPKETGGSGTTVLRAALGHPTSRLLEARLRYANAHDVPANESCLDLPNE